MDILEGNEEAEAKKYFKFIAEEIAPKSLCLRAKTGAIIVSKAGEIIGLGFNQPPGRKRLEKCLKDFLPKDSEIFKSDRTCCMHAEEVAIFDALSEVGKKGLEGSRLYFGRLNKEETGIEFAGQPYCTTCSKASYFNNISEFALWHNVGICVYKTAEYNTISFNHWQHPDKT